MYIPQLLLPKHRFRYATRHLMKGTANKLTNSVRLAKATCFYRSQIAGLSGSRLSMDGHLVEYGGIENSLPLRGDSKSSGDTFRHRDIACRDLRPRNPVAR